MNTATAVILLEQARGIDEAQDAILEDPVLVRHYMTDYSVLGKLVYSRTWSYRYKIFSVGLLLATQLYVLRIFYVCRAQQRAWRQTHG